MGKQFDKILDQMRKDALLIRDKRKVFVVEGPPGAGKSTYVRQRKKPGDIVVDLDTLAAAVQGSTDAHPDYSAVMEAVLAAREAIYSTIENREGKWDTAYVITSNPNAGEVARTADRLRGEIITMEVNQDLCIERIENDSLRTEKQRDIELAKNWYSQRQK